MLDVDLWDAWLFLEESSAEKVIREYLIPWFVPDLVNRLRTFSARSLDELPAKFSDFNRLFVYLHLEPAYKNRVWVFVDGGANETKVLGELRALYVDSGWNPEQFQQFSQHDFESFYPASFSESVASALV